MAIGIAIAHQAASTLHFEVCPGWLNGACTCPIRQVPEVDGAGQPVLDAEGQPVMVPDPNGTLVTPHPAFDFGAQPPDTRTAAQWAAACAKEALLLVKAQHAATAATATALTSLVGTTA